MRQAARPRLHRFLSQGLVYHVSTATRDRRPLFANPDNAQVVADAVQWLRRERAAVLAFAVMPDHLHLLLYPRPRFHLAQVVQSIKGYTARVINERMGQRDALWQKSYYDRIMRDERQLIDCWNTSSSTHL